MSQKLAAYKNVWLVFWLYVDTHSLLWSIVLLPYNVYTNSYIGLDREHVLKAEASYKSERDSRCADYLAKKKSLSEEMSTLQVCIAHKITLLNSL